MIYFKQKIVLKSNFRKYAKCKVLTVGFLEIVLIGMRLGLDLNNLPCVESVSVISRYRKMPMAERNVKKNP